VMITPCPSVSEADTHIPTCTSAWTLVLDYHHSQDAFYDQLLKMWLEMSLSADVQQVGAYSGLCHYCRNMYTLTRRYHNALPTTEAFSDADRMRSELYSITGCIVWCRLDVQSTRAY